MSDGASTHRSGFNFRILRAAIDFALSKLAVPEADGVKLDAVIEAGERLPGIAALWKEETVEERSLTIPHCAGW